MKPFSINREVFLQFLEIMQFLLRSRSPSIELSCAGCQSSYKSRDIHWMSFAGPHQCINIYEYKHRATVLVGHLSCLELLEGNAHRRQSYIGVLAIKWKRLSEVQTSNRRHLRRGFHLQCEKVTSNFSSTMMDLWILNGPLAIDLMADRIPVRRIMWLIGDDCHCKTINFIPLPRFHQQP